MLIVHDVKLPIGTNLGGVIHHHVTMEKRGIEQSAVKAILPPLLSRVAQDAGGWKYILIHPSVLADAGVQELEIIFQKILCQVLTCLSAEVQRSASSFKSSRRLNFNW